MHCFAYFCIALNVLACVVLAVEGQNFVDCFYGAPGCFVPDPRAMQLYRPPSSNNDPVSCSGN